MKKFNYKQWIVENKYNKQPLNEIWGLIAAAVGEWLYKRISDYYGSGNPLDWFGGGMVRPPKPPFGMSLDDVRKIASTNGNFENPKNPEELARVVMKYKYLTPYADMDNRSFDREMVNEQNTRSGEFKVKIPVQRPRAGDGEYMDFYQKMEDVTIKYGHATGPVDEVTISWGDESHTVDFEDEDVIDDHGNEGKDMIFVALSQDKKWKFQVDVSVGFNYEDSGEIQDVDWGTLEIEMREDEVSEGHCYDEDGKPMPEAHCNESKKTNEGHCYDEDGKPMPEAHCNEEKGSDNINKQKLKEVIKKVLNRLNEQTSDQCESLQSMPYFGMCCENTTHGNPPNPSAWNSTSCKPILNAAIGMGLTIPQLENCCNNDFSGGCEVTLPASHPSCVKCLSNQAAGVPIPPGGAAAGAPGSGDNCECCEGGSSGEDRCKDSNTAHPECFWCREENNPNMTCAPVGPNLGYALANNIPLFSDINDCHAQTDCGPSSEDPEIKCQCCDKFNQPVSMATTVSANVGCSALNNPPNFSNCQTHPLSGGTKLKCKTLPGPVDDFPIGLSETVKALGYIK